jgi:hypothetical protein
MARRLICVEILVVIFGVLFAQHVSAGITSVTANGPGGTVTGLAIDTTFVTDDSVRYTDANY